jgi:hypothetical protein
MCNQGFVADDPEFAWLGERAAGWQFGEQGILAALVDAIGLDGQCIEIGAGDGESLPLTIDPFYHRGYECVLFEQDPVSFNKLISKYPDALLRGEFTGYMEDIDDDPLLCIIDIDGYDMDAMLELLSQSTPDILMVEHFDKCHPANREDAESVPSWLMGLELAHGFKIQQNAATINNHATQFDYVRLGTTRVNSIFVHRNHLNAVRK